MISTREKMYEQIRLHGENLRVIFNLDDEPVKLCKRLRIIERAANRAALDYCNGVIEAEQIDAIEEKVLARLDKIINYRAQGIPVFFNRDPRGYALKIDDEYVRGNNLNIPRDWGGYGIIAPDFNE
jgi:hypothetical protein